MPMTKVRFVGLDVAPTGLPTLTLPRKPAATRSRAVPPGFETIGR